MSGRKYDTELILAAIEGSGGVTNAIAAKLGVHRWTVWNWLKDDEDLQRAVREEQERMLDTAESNLLKAVKKGDPWAIRYFLSRKGKHRGYTTSVEVRGELNQRGEVHLYLPDNGRDDAGEASDGS